MIFDTSQPMSKLYSRRDFLRAALAAGVLPILPRLVRAVSPVGVPAASVRNFTIAHCTQC